MHNSEHIKKEILDTVLDFLSGSEVVGAMFDRYDVPISRLSEVPIKFGTIPVSAKTKNEIIIINDQFLEDGSFAKELHYVVHELCHWLQQHCDDPHDLFERNGEKYLDMLTEIEAFCFQVRFMKEFYGKDEAEEYVDDLLDFHEIKGKERETKRKVLLLD